MLAELHFTAVGTGEEQKELIAKTVDIVEKSDLDYQVTSMGTIVEGEWDEIMLLLKKCHDALLKEDGVNRIISNVRIDDRMGESNRLKNGVLEVEYALGRDLKTGGLT